MNDLQSKMKAALYGLVFIAAATVLQGCNDFLHLGSWFNPTHMVKPTDTSTVNQIWHTFGPADETHDTVPNSVAPRDEDLVYTEEDYVIGPTDVLRISILDLLQEGLETLLERQVTYSGYIDLPLLDARVKAAGLTAEELTEVVKDAYRPDVLRDPTVSVTVAEQRGNTFSIRGAVNRPGTYAILRKDFRLTQALSLAGGLNQVNIEYIYVIRPTQSARGVAPEAEGAQPSTQSAEPTTTTAPTTRTKGDELRDLESAIPGVSAGPVSDERILLSSVDGGPGAAGGGSSDVGAAAITYKWVYSQGRWIRVPESAPAGTTTPLRGPQEKAQAESEDPFGWVALAAPKMARIIAIDLSRLDSEDQRMNIVIRDNDMIHIPPLELGEFYVMGEVQRPGVYSLTGRKITAKMAVAAAGNLNVLAWPNNSILIRRIGRDQEQIIPLPLGRIFQGTEADVFLKPNDVIVVGSHILAPVLAVWRNAFRMTYGFGFIYDRNYSEREFEIPIFFPKSGFRL